MNVAQKSGRCSLALAALASSIAAPALAGSVDIAIHARAATICQVSVGAGLEPVDSGTLSLGQITELCNNVDGYTLTLHHPRGLVDAWVLVGEERVAIESTSSTTVIVDSDEPAFRQRQLGIQLADNSRADMALSLTAEAKGAIF